MFQLTSNTSLKDKVRMNNHSCANTPEELLKTFAFEPVATPVVSLITTYFLSPLARLIKSDINLVAPLVDMVVGHSSLMNSDAQPYIPFKIKKRHTHTQKINNKLTK